MMRWLVCPFFTLAFGVRGWQGPAAQRLAVSSARRADAENEAAGADAIAATDAIAAATNALAAEDARLCAEARAATEAGDQAAARIALA